MGKKWGLYRVGGRSQPVPCTYCGRLTPRIKAILIRRRSGIDLRSIPGVDRRRVFLPREKGYACISCARHRGLLK
jgi:ribosomal protein S26